MNIREYEPLSQHTTLRTGGPARYFAEVAKIGEIHEALAFARVNSLPLFVLGGGSNVLVNDAGFAGLVLKLATRGFETREDASGSAEVIAAAGEDWDALVAFAVERGLRGLENMSLIPGTVGAAVVGNIGAYGAEVKETLAWVETIDRRDGTIHRRSASDCQFGYRHSCFKTAEGRNHLVIRAAFNLARAGELNIHYQDLRDYFARNAIASPSLGDVRAAVIAIRQSKLPDPARVGTAGSFFKNPVIARAQFESLASRYPGLPGYADGLDRVKVPLGWVLDKICGLKGARRGPVGTHPNQALCLVNEGGTACDVVAFAGEIAERVREKVGIEIEWEVERV